MNKKLKKRRQNILEKAEINLNFIVEIVNIKIKTVSALRKLGYSKKKSFEIMDSLIKSL